MTNQQCRAIVIDVCGHGLGHLGQVAPAIRELLRKRPAARVIVRSRHPVSMVRSFVGFEVDFEEPPPEAALITRGLTVVDVAAGAAACRALHARWDEHLDRETPRLATLAPAVLVADVPHLSLAAARRLGIPTIALCSLNWLDLYAPIVVASAMRRQFRTRSKGRIAPPTCSCNQDRLCRCPILPIRARLVPARAAVVGARSNFGPRCGLRNMTASCSRHFGGIRAGQPLTLPRISGVHWLAGPGHAGRSATATDVSKLDMSFIDVLASSDAVVTKIGYCTLVEAACHGVGVVSWPRPDWPESRPLMEWAKQHRNFALRNGGIENAAELQSALSMVPNAPPKTSASASGIAEAAEMITGTAGLA